MKILIIGKARHGKDTAAQILADKYNLKFASSSEFVAERAVYPTLMPKYGYTSKEEAFADRVNHRTEWRKLISKYNEDDPARLARELIAEHDIYVGMRSADEFDHAQWLFDLILYIEADDRVGGIDESMDIEADSADYVIDNNGDLGLLTEQLTYIYNMELELSR